MCRQRKLLPSIDQKEVTNIRSLLVCYYRVINDSCKKRYRSIVPKECTRISYVVIGILMTVVKNDVWANHISITMNVKGPLPHDQKTTVVP
jgi:hypothetical protein